MLTLLVIAVAVLFLGCAVDWYWSDGPDILCWVVLIVLVAGITVILCIYINAGVWVWNRT